MVQIAVVGSASRACHRSGAMPSQKSSSQRQTFVERHRSSKEVSVNCFGTRSWLSYVVVFSLAAVAWSQSRDTSAIEGHVGRVTDWTSSHILVSGGLTQNNLRLAQAEPRIRFHLTKRFQSPVSQSPRFSSSSNDTRRDEAGPLVTKVIDGSSNTYAQRRTVDWSVPLGTGHVAAHQFPAKYGFNLNNPPDCVNDYVVFPLNVGGVTNGQANIIGINNLYSGPSGSPPCGAAPNVNWAYNGSTSGGKVLTSPGLSLDGTKIACIESTA